MNSKRELAKLEKEQRIIAKSKELFVAKGYENTSVNDIVDATNLTKRTLYAYFASKEDIFFAVMLDSYGLLWAQVSAGMLQAEKGLGKIQAACYSFGDFYKRDPALLKLMSLTNLVNSTVQSSPFKVMFNQFSGQIFHEIYKVFEEGIDDHSIRKDLDIKYAMSSFLFTLIAFFNMLSLSGKSFLEFMDLDEQEFVKHSIEQLISTIWNKDF